MMLILIASIPLVENQPAGQVIECRTQSFQAGREVLGFATDADANMLWHFKKSARHDGRVILLVQQLAQRLNAAVPQEGKRCRTRIRAHGLKIVTRVEKVIQRRAIVSGCVWPARLRAAVVPSPPHSGVR